MIDHIVLYKLASRARSAGSVTTSGNTIVDTIPPQGLTHFGALFAPRNLRTPCTTTTLLTGVDFPQGNAGSQYIQFRQVPAVTEIHPDHLATQQVVDHPDINIKTVCKPSCQKNDFSDLIYVERTPLCPVDRLDTWQERHPARTRP
ncbi:hypothetical protein ACWDUX_08815 [Streptomyces sp. NPDC003444]